MKTVLKNVGKLWYALLCTIIVSCSDSSDSPAEPPTPDPEPVEQNYRLKSGVNEIKGGNLDYVVEAIEGTTLVLSGKYPSDELPVIGEIVFIYPNAKKLPYGFLGKVSKINKSGGNYSIETEQVALDEAFSYLSVDETIDMELSAGEEASDSRVAYENIDGYKCLSQNIKGEVELLEHMKVEVEGKLTYGLRIRKVADIDSANVKKYLRVDISQYMAFNAEAYFSIISEGEGEKKWTEKLVKLFKHPIIEPRVPAGLVSLFATPKVEVNLVAKLEAALSLGFGNEFVCERTTSVIYDNGQWKMEETPANGNESSSFYMLPNTEIKFEESAFLGVSLSPKICLFQRSDMEIEMTFAAGPEFQAELNYNPKEDKSIYEALKDDKMGFYWALKGEAKASANIFKKELEWTLPLIDWTSKEGIESYIFPDFTDCKIEPVEDKAFKLASTTLKNDIAFRSSVGIAAYDANDSIIFKTEPKQYLYEKKFKDENPLELKYENTPKNANYTICTYVKWGNKYIKCKSLNSSIVGLWCPCFHPHSQSHSHSDHSHFEFMEDGTWIFHRFDLGNQEKVEENYDTWYWDENMEALFMCAYSDPYKIEKLDADSLVLKEIYLGTEDRPTVYRLRRINSHNECLEW